MIDKNIIALMEEIIAMKKYSFIEDSKDVVSQKAYGDYVKTDDVLRLVNKYMRRKDNE